MKVLLINGSPHAKGCTYTALMECKKIFDKHGVETEVYQIGGTPVPACVACGLCKQTGYCCYDDGVNEIHDNLSDIDGIIVGSPVYYAGASGQVTSLLDRLFMTAGASMKGKPAACVVSCRRGGASAAFETVNKYFMMHNMPIVTSNYWNQVHGNTPEEVQKDEEGMQTLRNLAENMVWLMKCIEAGKKENIVCPTYEPKIKTNFIR